VNPAMTPRFIASPFLASVIHFSNSVASPGKRHHPYSLSRPRVGPSFFSLLHPSTYEGDGAPGGATIVLCCRTPSREHGRLPARHHGVLLTAPGRAFRWPLPFSGNGHASASSWQAAPIGHRAEPRRRPGACFAESTRAGAASGSTIKTPL